ncbi:MAG TPA: peptidoglycan DD-metalloendopeptidase family protein [Actinomycetota bacterium]|nr:peptidoglycan DD-metalloendopeptidase family protein [Actinomycetota bacterium]
MDGRRRRRGERARGIFSLALLLCVAAVAVPAAAGPRERLEEIERREQEVARRIDRLADQKGQILDRIGVVDERRQTVESQVEELDAELAQLTGRIDEAKARLTRAQQRLALLSDELERVLGELVARTDIFTERAVAAYKAGPAAYVDSLLSSESIGDLLQRQAYYEAALDSDARLIEDIQVLRAETEEKRAEVEERKEEIALAKAELERDRAAVAQVRDARADALAELEGVLDTKQTLLAQVESKKSKYEAVQQQLEQESAQIAQLLSSPSSSSAPPPATGGGTFAWPASGPVTSPYGYRTHPIFGDRRLHTGIDIGAGYGATVISSERGSVAFVGVMSGYGNVVVVDHGGGLATTYNHLSAFSVSSGQRVSRGTPVGAVGCSGYCTGPHLHFEVRVNGSPVDPMPYLQ